MQEGEEKSAARESVPLVGWSALVPEREAVAMR
jgi:hypothetical protein